MKGYKAVWRGGRVQCLTTSTTSTTFLTTTTTCLTTTTTCLGTTT